MCACACARVYALGIVSMDKILRFTNTLKQKTKKIFLEGAKTWIKSLIKTNVTPNDNFPKTPINQIIKEAVQRYILKQHYPATKV